jgi:4-amino-4-deoxy-L-arabinose transferase-like glycosyltransferase
MPMTRPAVSTLWGRTRATAAAQPQLIWIGMIAVCAIGLRVAYLLWQLSAPGFQWSDPDGYLRQAATLTAGGSWRWTLKAVQYNWGGYIWLLPPGYPVFLSLFYGAGSTPLPAAVAQAIVGGLATISIYFLGRSLHTPTTGWIAACVWAIWFPAVAGRETFVQEQVYIPLLWTAVAALAVCIDRWLPPSRFVGAGALLGIAALCRAMPLFFMIPLVPLLWWFGRAHQDKGKCAAAFLGGFALVTLPYILWLSAATSHLVLIDDHMMIDQNADISDRRFMSNAIAITIDGFVNDIGWKATVARGLFKVYGPSWLYHYGGAVSEAMAPLMGLAVHVTFDGLFVAVAVAAPLGLAFARGRQVAVTMFAWILLVTAASAAAGFTGLRYRAPFEGLLICAAATVVGGGLRNRSRPALILASAATVVLAAITVPEYVASWKVSVPYGLNGWTREKSYEQTFGRGSAGFYAPAIRGAIDVELEGMADAPTSQLLVRVEGVPVERLRLAPHERQRIRVPVGNRPIAFVEVSAENGAHQPAPAYYIRTVR